MKRPNTSKVVTKFKDHFSQHAAIYAQYRPTYPVQLMRYLSSLCRDKLLAWDCATGSGQTAILLAAFFNRVIASDASAQQLAFAYPHPQVNYIAATAENSALMDKSIDLICVAQAAHWLNLPAFYKECRRIAKPGAVIALWCYQLMQIEPVIDKLIDDLYQRKLGDFWPEERYLIEEGYQSLEFPFTEIETPAFSMEAQWTFPQFIGYLQSWSAVQKYSKQHSVDPKIWLSGLFEDCWRDPQRLRQVSWPLRLRVGLID